MFSICEGLLIAIPSAQLMLFLLLVNSHNSASAIAICCHVRGTFDFIKSKMDCDKRIDELLSAQSAEDRAPLACSRASAGTAATLDVQGQEVCAQALRKHHERLAALVGGGQAEQYLGKSIHRRSD